MIPATLLTLLLQFAFLRENGFIRTRRNFEIDVMLIVMSQKIAHMLCVITSTLRCMNLGKQSCYAYKLSSGSALFTSFLLGN